MGKGSTGNQKQKNKPFKGRKRAKSKSKIPVLRKSIQKQKRRNLTHKVRKLQLKQRKQDQRTATSTKLQETLAANTSLTESQRRQITILLNQIPAPKVVVLAGFNQNADPLEIMQGVATELKKYEKAGVKCFIPNAERKGTGNGNGKTSHPPYFYVSVSKNTSTLSSSSTSTSFTCLPFSPRTCYRELPLHSEHT